MRQIPCLLLACLVGCAVPEDAGRAGGRAGLLDDGGGRFTLADDDYGVRDRACATPRADHVPGGFVLRVYGHSPTRSAQVDFTFNRPPTGDRIWPLTMDAAHTARPAVAVRGVVTDRELVEDRSWHPDAGVVSVLRTEDALVLRWEDLSVDGEALGSGEVRCPLAADEDEDGDEDGHEDALSPP